MLKSLSSTRSFLSFPKPVVLLSCWSGRLGECPVLRLSSKHQQMWWKCPMQPSCTPLLPIAWLSALLMGGMPIKEGTENWETGGLTWPKSFKKAGDHFSCWVQQAAGWHPGFLCQLGQSGTPVHVTGEKRPPFCRCFLQICRILGSGAVSGTSSDFHMYL